MLRRLASTLGSSVARQAAARPASMVQQTRAAGGLMVHRDSAENNDKLSWDYSAENMPLVHQILERYPPNYKRSAMIPLLDVAQQQNKGYLSVQVMNKVAEILEVAPIRVYEVATFYSMFNRVKMGKYHVMALSDHLGVKKFENTPDGMFTLGEMECMGCCVNAPMIAVADYTDDVRGYSYNYYEDLTPADAVAVVKALKAGQKPRVGSQHRDKRRTFVEAEVEAAAAAAAAEAAKK